MRPGKFTIDTFGDAVFDGFTTGETWNGWAHPHFTALQAQRIVEAHNAQGGKAWYDDAQDAFSFEMGEDEVDTFPAETIEGKKYWPVGAGCWIWEEELQEAVQ